MVEARDAPVALRLRRFGELVGDEVERLSEVKSDAVLVGLLGGPKSVAEDPVGRLGVSKSEVEDFRTQLRKLVLGLEDDSEGHPSETCVGTSTSTPFNFIALGTSLFCTTAGAPRCVNGCESGRSTSEWGSNPLERVPAFVSCSPTEEGETDCGSPRQPIFARGIEGEDGEVEFWFLISGSLVVCVNTTIHCR